MFASYKDRDWPDMAQQHTRFNRQKFERIKTINEIHQQFNENLSATHLPYICTGNGGHGAGDTPRLAIQTAVDHGLDREKDHWAIWENLVTGGRIRLDEKSKGITVDLPEEMSMDDYQYWTHPNRPARLRMIACSQKFANRIIKVRSDRLDIQARKHRQIHELNVDEILAEASKLLGCDLTG